ncbi:hypothetical protein NKJ74_06100 [Mesorhizobium sp. M0046]|uniref:hypothetical protein n=1 Tax=Mesorhizobium sp. M0046 TaxID=2956858 RepID=UPI003336F206
MAILMVQMNAPPAYTGGGMLQVFGEVRPCEALFARTPKNKDDAYTLNHGGRLTQPRGERDGEPGSRAVHRFTETPNRSIFSF